MSVAVAWLACARGPPPSRPTRIAAHRGQSSWRCRAPEREVLLRCRSNRRASVVQSLLHGRPCPGRSHQAARLPVLPADGGAPRHSPTRGIKATTWVAQARMSSLRVLMSASAAPILSRRLTTARGPRTRGSVSVRLTSPRTRLRQPLLKEAHEPVRVVSLIRQTRHLGPETSAASCRARRRVRGSSATSRTRRRAAARPPRLMMMSFVSASRAVLVHASHASPASRSWLTLLIDLIDVPVMRAIERREEPSTSICRMTARRRRDSLFTSGMIQAGTPGR